MAQEIELKLAFPPTARLSVLAALKAMGAQPTGPAQTLTNTYFDTADQALSRARVALRTRKAADTWLQTVKCAAPSQGGLSSRPEWEQAFSGSFDFSAVDVPSVKALLDKSQAHIVPLFTTDFERETFLYCPDGSTRIYLMVDTGNVQAGGHTETISELELELDEGSPDALFALACALAETLPLLPYDPSKAARGYRLFRNEPIRPIVASAPSGKNAEVGFCPLAQQALIAWAANQHGAITSTDPEFLHQLRTALRRLRTLIRLYAPGLPEGFATHWSERLAAVFDQLSTARDLDVLHQQILPDIATDAPAQALNALIAHARVQAANTRQSVIDVLAGPGNGRILLAFGRALYTLAQHEMPQQTASQHRKVLEKSRRRARRHLAQALQTPDERSLHRLRIAIKNLRYAMECWGPQTLGPKRTARHLRRVKTVLQNLGLLQDRAVALETLRGWSTSKHRSLNTASSFVTGWITATNLQSTSSILPRCVALLKKKRWRTQSGSRL